ncbi:DUF695 domain-containing protein [Bremerella sp.]|uniref:DUF695 domain-containing protein n=1 Tax=Bremerella sp. TaxID=2795602 RepID=UPI00391B0E3A
MTAFRVIIPDDEWSLLEFTQNDLPGVAVVNTSLHGFEPKEVFAWHLSLMLNFEELIDNGMPSQLEREIVDPFCERLESEIRGKDKQKPNALFLARITWNGTRELIWRVFDPELPHFHLQEIINSTPPEYPRTFDYQMDEDPEWKLAEWHLSHTGN